MFWRHTLRHREALKIERPLFDVNNPSQEVVFSNRRSSGILWDIECGQVQKAMLDQARTDAVRWKAGTDTSGGCIRSGTLHAHYDKKQKRWWFEAHLSVGTKPEKDMRLSTSSAYISIHTQVSSLQF